MYAVKEIYYTLQGEGANAGRAAVFCRFAGCNLWTGREEDRYKAVCQFCDTDFNGTKTPPPGIDWLCVSPKIGADLLVTRGHEIKLVYPQLGGEPERFAEMMF